MKEKKQTAIDIKQQQKNHVLQIDILYFDKMETSACDILSGREIVMFCAGWQMS